MIGSSATLEVLSDSFDFLVGSVFRDKREEVRKEVYNHVKSNRRTRGALPEDAIGHIHQRVLYVDARYIIAICVEDPLAWDVVIPRSDADMLVATRQWIETSTEPLRVLRVAEEVFSEKTKRCRARNVELLNRLIALGDGIFDRRLRRRAVLEICEGKGVQEIEVYRPLRKYLQGGRNPNALAGRWFIRGRGIGLGARIGQLRPHRPGSRCGRPRLDGARSFVMTEKDVALIIRSASKYYHHPRGGNWRRAWLLTVGYHYLDLGSALRDRPSLLQKVPIKRYPSYRQFMRWALRDPDGEAAKKRQIGQRRFDLEARSQSSRTELKVTGPGSHFFIDATPFDIVVVHTLWRRPIGKVKLYLLVDLFSHLIVGYYLHLGNAGYDAASLALLAAAEDKVALCARHGVTIGAKDWPAACLPGLLISDSELASFRAHALVENQVCDLEIVAPYRADLKGLVEALIGSANRKAQHLPGYSPSPRKRAEVSPDVTAALDISELNRIVIYWILQSNRRVMRDYHRSADMIADNVAPTPLDIWNWGIPNAGGRRRKWNIEMLELSCLPTDTARMTPRGLKIRGLFYAPEAEDVPEFELWRVRAGERTWPETISYDPSKAARTWLHHGDRLIRLYLTAESGDHSEWSFLDVDSELSEKRKTCAIAESAKVPDEAANEVSIEETIKDGMKKTEAVRGTVARRKREKVNKPADALSEKDAREGRPRPASVTHKELAVPNTLTRADTNAALSILRKLRASRQR